MSQLFAFLFALMIMLWAVPSQAMAAEVQQPPKAMVTGVQLAQVTPEPPREMPGAATTGVQPFSPGTEPHIYAASLCWTCGGAFPIYAGIIPTASAASERGPNCADPIDTSLNDHFPRLCTK